MRSISSPTSKRMNTSSNTSTCSRLPIISTSFISSAMGELSNLSCARINLSMKKMDYSYSNSSSMPFKYSTSTISCIET